MALEAVLVAVVLVALSPALLVLLVWKLIRCVQRRRRPDPGSGGRSTSWGLFVSC